MPLTVPMPADFPEITGGTRGNPIHIQPAEANMDYVCVLLVAAYEKINELEARIVALETP